jgi:hypothetical protein
MFPDPPTQRGAPPEALIQRLVRRLRQQRIRDGLLLFLPPAAAFVYLVYHLYRASWISPESFMLLIMGVIWSGLLLVALRYRPAASSLRSAARLADEKAAAEDRFLTLATIEPSSCSQPFIARLRQETSALLGRIDLRRDFPYEFKRSFYWSAVASVIMVLLFHSLLPLAQSRIPPMTAAQQISSLAEKMAQRPGLEQLARELKSLAAKIDEPNMALQDKQQRLQAMRQKIEDQRKDQAQKENQDLLGEAASTLKGMEDQAPDRQQQQDRGDGGLQSNLPQAQGEGKAPQGSGGNPQGDLNAQKNDGMEEGKSAKADPKEKGTEKTQPPQAGQANDKNQLENEPGQDMRGKTQRGNEEQLSKSGSGGTGRSEEKPQVPPPAERFTKPGEEGKGGLKGSRYITVQLPEEIAAEGKGDSATTRQSKEAKTRSKIPISNVPLPAHVPDAPSEKQNVPLEYRGIIR